MPRYFFNVHNVEPSTDDIGEVFKDKESAWNEATKIAGEIIKDIDGRFRPGQEWALEVTDENRKPLYVIRISAQQTK
jgi:hypothetical protein